MSYYRYGGVLVNEPSSNGFTENPSLKNLFNPSDFEIGALIDIGTVNEAQTSCITSEFIPVVGGKVLSTGYISSYVYSPLIVPNWREYCFAYCFYKQDKTFLSYGGLSRQENEAIGVTIPQNAKYVRVSWAYYGGSDYFRPTETPEKCYVTCGDSVPTKPLPYFCNDGYTTELDESPFFGEALLIFGDSYSDSWGGHSWDAKEISQVSQGGNAENNIAWSGKLFWSKVCSEFGLTIDNRATGGSNLPYGSSSYEQWNGMDKIKNLVTEVQNGATPPKFLVLQYGTNCWESQVGTVNDAPSESASTYPSAIKWAIDTIKAEMPNTKIGVLLPLTCNNKPHNFNAHDVLLDVMKTDAYQDIPFVDMAEVSGLVLEDLPDGVHPSSEKANKTYANWCRVLLMKMIM